MSKSKSFLGYKITYFIEHFTKKNVENTKPLLVRVLWCYLLIKNKIILITQLQKYQKFQSVPRLKAVLGIRGLK